MTSRILSPLKGRDRSSAKFRSCDAPKQSRSERGLPYSSEGELHGEGLASDLNHWDF
jgi:hypothetical protein